MNNLLKLLIIGNEKWCNKLSKLLHNSCTCNIETISSINDAIKRLHHNSYDILLLQLKYAKCNSIRLSQLSYAMSRPSIILCNSIFIYTMYKLWKLFSSFTNKYKISKKLIHILLLYNFHILKDINLLLNLQKLIHQISSLIRSKLKNIK